MKKLQQIDYACEVGDRVFLYKTFRGEKLEGTLVEWEDSVAIIKMDDGTTERFEC
jgi:hypothetical protein